MAFPTDNYIVRSLLPAARDESRSENPLAFQTDERGPRILVPDVDEFMVDQALLWGGDFSWADMAAAVNQDFDFPDNVPSAEGVRLHCLGAGWTDGRVRTLPWLNDGHVNDRFMWAAEFVDEQYTAWVDVDEKWFYVVRLHGRRKKAPGQILPPRFCKSKRNIPKVMFLSAVARPRPGFNGIVGFWRVAEPKKFKSGPRKDETWDVDKNMTAELYFKMMKGKVFPKILKAFEGTGIRHVVVQQDGARPHTGKDVVNRLNEYGKTLSPSIEVRTQPAQSPDLNVNDLALFRSLDVAVRKLRRTEGNEWDKEKLARDVHRAVKDYPAEKLEEMWDYKSYVMQAILDCGGGNDYPRHRPK